MTTNFIAKNWWGKYRLAMSYWVIFVVLGNLVAIASVVVYALFPSTLVGLAASLAMVVFLIWSSVGVWRSANIYEIKKPDKWHWAILAKIIVVLSWGLFLKSLFIG